MGKTKAIVALAAMFLMLSGSFVSEDVQAVEVPATYQLQGSMGVVSN